ncbi:MAG: hypothetical protein ACRC7O_04460 [Fimbriiglobus sp.]
MQFLLANAGKKHRTVVLGGRDHLVVPMTMLVPGVLNGSKGPLYYPADETEKSADSWNGIPIVDGHPTDPLTNSPVSARSPGVMESHGLGTVFNARFHKGKLKADGYFDVEKCRRVNPAVLARIENGLATELSTGLYTKNYKAPAGALCNLSKKSYEFVARGHRPDHLAVLTRETGACSLKDGCGVLVNSSPPAADPDRQVPAPAPETTVKKAEMIEFLATNCACWEGKETTLNAFDDDHLDSLVTVTEKALALNEISDAIQTAGYEELQVNAMPAFVKKKIEDDEESEMEEPAPKKGKKGPVGNAGGGAKTAADWYAEAPPEIQAVVRNAKKTMDARKAELVGRLVANAKDDAGKAKAAKVYEKMDADELEELADALPTGNRTFEDDNPFLTSNRHKRPAVYGPSKAERVDNRTRKDGDGDFGDEDDLLIPPTIDYAENSVFDRKKARA